MKTQPTMALPGSGWFRSIFFILLTILLTTPVPGQSASGRLRIRVVDVNGAVVAGATVTVTRQDTGQSLTQTSSPDGVAVFNLEPGRYNVRIEVTGFKAETIQDVQVTIAEAREVEMRLTPGGVPETISVGVEEERQEQLSAIPNFNNDLTPLLQVVPGAVATGSSALGKIVIDGKGKDQQVIRLDGIDATQLVDLPGADPAIDVLSSFQKPEVAFDIDNSAPKSRAFAPMFGPGTGTVVQGLSYRGSDTWQAQVYGENRNDAFNARNFFDFDGRNGVRRSRFGGKFGAPIIPHKASFYFAYDGVRGRSEQSAFEAVPIDSFCHCGGGPLASLMSGYLPAGTAVVPGASLSPDFLIVKRRLRTTVEANAWDARLDLPPPAQEKFTLRFTRQAATNLVPDGVTGRVQRQHVLFNNALARYKLVASNAIHEFKFGVNQTRATVDSEAGSSTAPSLSQSLIAVSGSIGATGLPGGIPTVSVATLGALVKGAGRGFKLSPISFNPGYDFYSPLNGNRELFFGAEARFIRLAFDRLGGLTYAFPSLASLRAGTPDTVSFLSDLSAPGPFGGGAGPRHGQQSYFMGYFQMTSQWSPTFKATYGLRYDYFGPVSERDNRAVVVDPQTGVILPAGSSFYRAKKNNFQPRFAFEYRLADSGLFKDTVLRAGAGVYSGVPKIGDLLLPIDSDRFNTGIKGGTFPLDPIVLVNGFLNNPETRQFQPLSFTRNFATPERAYKWEASLTKPVKEIYDFKVLYTGNVGRNLPLAGVANQIVSVATNSDQTKPGIVIRQLDIVRGGQVFKSYGEFFFRSSEGRSSYEALTIQLKRNSTKSTQTLPRWLNPADFNTQYTLSRNTGNVSGAVASNPLSFASDDGFNAADARHTFGLSAVYNLWEVLGRSRTDLLYGWRIVPSITARSGLPLTIRLDRPDVVYVDGSGQVYASPAIGRTAVINTPGGGATGGARIPDLLPGVNPYSGNGLELLNPQAFSIPRPGSFGNLRRGQLRGRGSVQADLGLMRNLFGKEKGVAADFKIEIFNLFNHTNFSNPTAALPNALGTTTADNQIQPGVPFTRSSAGVFGLINSADPGRQIQFSFTLRFNQGFSK